MGVSRALESRESLSAAAEGCDGPTLGRLLLNVEHIITQICSSISGVTEAVEQSVCTFSTIARRRLRSRDKLFESQIDELSDTCKMLETLVHQFASLSMPHSGMDSLLDSICSANEMLTNTDRLNAHSALSSYLETIPHLHSRIQTAVDPARSVVTHPHWLSREEVNLVRINVLDCGGAPVFRLDPMDVNCSVIIHTSSGSEAAPIIQASRIRYNTVTVSVIVPPSCTMHSCMLSINFTGSSMQLPMKVRAFFPFVSPLSLNCHDSVAVY